MNKMKSADTGMCTVDPPYLQFRSARVRLPVVNRSLQIQSEKFRKQYVNFNLCAV